MITAAILLAWAGAYCLDLFTLPTPNDWRRTASYTSTVLTGFGAMLAIYAVNR